MQMMFNFSVIRLTFGISSNNFNPITHWAVLCANLQIVSADKEMNYQPYDESQQLKEKQSPFGFIGHCINILHGEK